GAECRRAGRVAAERCVDEAEVELTEGQLAAGIQGALDGTVDGLAGRSLQPLRHGGRNGQCGGTVVAQNALVLHECMALKCLDQVAFETEMTGWQAYSVTALVDQRGA